MKHLPLLLIFILSEIATQGQILTKEDSLNAGLNPSGKNVILSGYGQAKYSYNRGLKTAEANLTRAVIFMGYKFNRKITFFSELEVENAKVDGNGGGISFEQCVLKLDINRNNYFLAGLIIPRIGIMNENHLPVTFNGNDRHMIEQLVIPSTWREIGLGYYGSSTRMPGMNWSLAILNGLNAEGITGGTGIRNARYEGRNASASNLATTASLLYYIRGFRFQASGYYGGTVGLTPRAADSLGLDSGPFGTPVALGEFNVMYRNKGLVLKGLGVYSTVADADKLNTAFATNAATSMYGFMAEIGYDILTTTKWKDKQLILFSRYESMDLMATVPRNGIKDNRYNHQYLITGLSFLPVRGVAIKLDWTHLSTGEANQALIFNPSPNAPAYLRENDFYQIGIAYSF